jgi:hypothetical protein
MVLDMLGGVTELPAHDDVMETAHMGNGVTIIAMWSPVETHYRHVRGQHVAGGTEAIDFEGLFECVPDTITTQIVVVASSTRSVAFVLENVQQRIGVDFRAASVRVMRDCAQARVNRSGIVS